MPVHTNVITLIGFSKFPTSTKLHKEYMIKCKFSFHALKQGMESYYVFFNVHNTVLPRDVTTSPSSLETLCAVWTPRLS